MGAVDNEHRWPQSPSRNSGCVLWRAVTCCDTDTTDEPTKLLRQKSTETIQSSSIYSGIETEDLTWPFWSVWRSERHQTSRWSAARQTLVLEMSVSKAYDVPKRFVRSRWIMAACLYLVISAVPKVSKASECFQGIWAKLRILMNSGKPGAGTLTLWITLRPLFMALAGGGSAPSIYQT